MNKRKIDIDPDEMCRFQLYSALKRSRMEGSYIGLEDISDIIREVWDETDYAVLATLLRLPRQRKPRPMFRGHNPSSI